METGEKFLQVIRNCIAGVWYSIQKLQNLNTTEVLGYYLLLSKFPSPLQRFLKTELQFRLVEHVINHKQTYVNITSFSRTHSKVNIFQ